MKPSSSPRSRLTLVFSLGILAAGCDGKVSGSIDGYDFAKARSVLYGEIDGETYDALVIQMSEYPFTCEDLTQNWTPQELKIFPAYNQLTIVTGDNEVREYSVLDPDDLQDAAEATFTVFSAELKEDQSYFAEAGTVMVSGFEERYGKIGGEFSFEMVGGDEETGTIEGKFNAEFCRNLSQITE